MVVEQYARVQSRPFRGGSRAMCFSRAPKRPPLTVEESLPLQGGVLQLKTAGREVSHFQFQSSPNCAISISREIPLLTLPESYPLLLQDIKTRIRESQIKAALAVNQELLRLYWWIGREIVIRIDCAKISRFRKAQRFFSSRMSYRDQKPFWSHRCSYLKNNL